MILHALVALMLIAQAQEEIAPTPSEPTFENGLVAESAAAPEADAELICRNVRRSGTRVARQVCRTRAEIDAAEEAAKESMRSMMENSGHNNTASN
ncbi:MAG: hypothetical protein ABL864_10755 [Terricaulis sp.]|jgi:CBS domain containing-hemolysin-like protein